MARIGRKRKMRLKITSNLQRRFWHCHNTKCVTQRPNQIKSLFHCDKRNICRWRVNFLISLWIFGLIGLNFYGRQHLIETDTFGVDDPKTISSPPEHTIQSKTEFSVLFFENLLISSILILHDSTNFKRSIDDRKIIFNIYPCSFVVISHRKASELVDEVFIDSFPFRFFIAFQYHSMERN